MMLVTRVCVSSTKIIISSLMRNEKEIGLPCRRCDLRIVPGEKKPTLFLALLVPRVILQSICSKTWTMFSSPKVPKFLYIYKPVCQGREVAFCRAAASSAGPPSPSAATPMGPRDKPSTKREDLELPWLLLQTHCKSVWSLLSLLAKTTVLL